MCPQRPGDGECVGRREGDGVWGGREEGDGVCGGRREGDGVLCVLEVIRLVCVHVGAS